MKLYAHSYRHLRYTEVQPYRVGPFASLEEWRAFKKTKRGRKMEFCHALVDEATDPPTLVEAQYPLHYPVRLLYPLLIRSWDGALITGWGTLVFEGGPR